MVVGEGGNEILLSQQLSTILGTRPQCPRLEFSMHPTIRILIALAGLSQAGASALTTDSTTTPVLSATEGVRQVTLRWSLCPSCDSYEVFRSSASSGPWASIARISGITSHKDSALAPKTLYFYRVSGFRGTIEGDFSDVLQVITQDSLPDSVQTKQKTTPR